MKDKTRIALILGAAAVVVGGAGFYLLKVYLPGQKREAAQTEIDGWERRLGAARACLFGEAPASGNSAEALAVREMMPDPWERKTCTTLIGRLNRGIAEDTGLMSVEHAWMTVDRAASKVANSFATHVDPFGEAIEERGKPSPLPAALEALDAAHAELRAAAGMSPPPTATLPTLPTGTWIPLALGERRVKVLDSWPPPSSGSIAFGSTTNGQVQLVLLPGAAPMVLPVPARAIRGTPDASWGAAGLAEELAIAPIDAEGAFGTIAPLKMPHPTVLAAIGKLDAGMVIATDAEGLLLARSSGAGFVADPTVFATRVSVTVEPGGRAAVVWNAIAADDDGTLHGFLSFGDAAPQPVELGAGYVRSMCLTHAGAWIDTGDQFLFFDGATASPHVMSGHALAGCTADAALLHAPASDRYAVCTESCRPVELTNFRTTRIATIVDGKVHAVRARGQVIGVWRENLPPRFFALEHDAVPVQVTSDGKVLDVLATTKDAVGVIRIPLN